MSRKIHQRTAWALCDFTPDIDGKPTAGYFVGYLAYSRESRPLHLTGYSIGTFARRADARAALREYRRQMAWQGSRHRSRVVRVMVEIAEMK